MMQSALYKIIKDIETSNVVSLFEAVKGKSFKLDYKYTLLPDTSVSSAWLTGEGFYFPVRKVYVPGYEANPEVTTLTTSALEILKINLLSEVACDAPSVGRLRSLYEIIKSSALDNDPAFLTLFSANAEVVMHLSSLRSSIVLNRVFMNFSMIHRQAK